jgi:hypothetical protein
MIKRLVMSRPTAAGRQAYTEACAALIQNYQSTFEGMLLESDDGPTKDDAKPFAYLLVTLIMVDVRSSFPTLLSKLNTPGYETISRRLAAAFDIMSSFIGYLVRSMDAVFGDEAATQRKSKPSLMEPDLLLKLRKDIAETLSLTIEYLRDRWDASIAGAAYLHPDARTSTTEEFRGKRQTLTWESMSDDVTQDPLIVSGLRTLALWLREDDNENLRIESAGLMDLLIELYKVLSTKLDLKFPVLTALDAILTTEAGIDNFLEQDGWVPLATDLSNIIQTYVFNNRPAPNSAVPGLYSATQDLIRGVEIIRVLTTTVDDFATGEPREEWMQVVKLTATMPAKHDNHFAPLMELKVAMLQLAVSLIQHSSPGGQKKYKQSVTAIRGLAKQLKAEVMNNEDKIDDAEDLEGNLDELLMALMNV